MGVCSWVGNKQIHYTILHYSQLGTKLELKSFHSTLAQSRHLVNVHQRRDLLVFLTRVFYPQLRPFFSFAPHQKGVVMRFLGVHQDHRTNCNRRITSFSPFPSHQKAEPISWAFPVFAKTYLVRWSGLKSVRLVCKETSKQEDSCSGSWNVEQLPKEH